MNRLGRSVSVFLFVAWTALGGCLSQKASSSGAAASAGEIRMSDFAAVAEELEGKAKDDGHPYTSGDTLLDDATKELARRDPAHSDDIGKASDAAKSLRPDYDFRVGYEPTQLLDYLGVLKAGEDGGKDVASTIQNLVANVQDALTSLLNAMVDVTTPPTDLATLASDLRSAATTRAGMEAEFASRQVDSSFSTLHDSAVAGDSTTSRVGSMTFSRPKTRAHALPNPTERRRRRS